MTVLSDPSGMTPQQKRELLRGLLKKGGPIPVQPLQASYALSAAQRRLWFLHQLKPDSGRYHVVHAVKVEGPLNVEVFQRALDRVVERHESLRTTFRFDGVEPVQQVATTFSIELARAEANHGSIQEREKTATRILKQEAGRAFDLENGPLLRAGTIKIASGIHWLYVVMHHIVSDGWSLRVFLRDLMTFSIALETGSPELLPPLSHQYKDYAAWQSAQEATPEVMTQLEYWKHCFEKAPALQRLPFDYSRPEDLSDRGAQVPFSIPVETGLRFRELCEAQGATLYAGLLTAFQTLLYRYSDDEVVVTGFPVAGRSRREWEPVIGLFTNMLVMATAASPEKSFSSLMNDVSQRLIEAQANQDLPFDVLVEHLHPPRKLSHHPVFQTVLLLEEQPAGGVLGPFRFTPLEIDGGFTKFDLTLALRSGASLTGYFEYSTDLFDESTIRRMGQHFSALLEAIVTNPTQCLGELSFISPDEQRAALHEWNDTRAEYPSETSLHRLFEAQAVRFASSPAIIHRSGTVTYAELNAQANRLARNLITSGALPGGRIGIALSQSPAVIVAILATLKTGGTFVPLDPLHPTARNHELLRDCEANLVITDQKHASALAPFRVAIWNEQSIGIAADLPCDASAAAPAYIMYTSGSTGRPKGVIVPQRAVSRLVLNTNYIAIQPSDRIAQLSTFLFDASIFEIFGALLNGAAMVMIDKETALSPADFAAAAAKHRITVGFFTSSLFNHLASTVPEAFHKFHSVLVGGETVDPKWFAHLFRSGYRGKLINAYGPTEATTFSICNTVTAWDDETKSVPLGRPVSNTTAYVTNRGLGLLPPGVVGEICIGGDGLAIGYVNDDAATREKFVDNPFAPGTKLYRTGDLGRYRPNGEIEYLGRADRQLKIRGHRIEPAEIESLLEQHPAVLDAVVSATKGDPASRTLSASVIPKPGVSPTEAELREFLRFRLPDYLIPSRFTLLKTMPLSENGKLDYSKLSAVDPPRSVNAVSLGSPTTSLVLEVWKEMLGVERLSADDNFFDLGGTSLLAVRMVMQMEQRLARRIPLALFFSAPTADGFARLLEIRPKHDFQTLFCLREGDSRLAPVVVVHAGPFFHEVLSHLEIENPFWTIVKPTAAQISDPPSIEQIASLSCTELREAFPNQFPILAGYCLSGLIGFEIANQLHRDRGRTGPVVLMDVVSPSYYWERGRRARISEIAANLRYKARILRDTPAAARSTVLRGFITKCLARLTGGARETEGISESNLRFLDAARRYRPEFYPGELALVRASIRPDTDRYLGWRQFACGVAIHEVSCTHAELLKRTNAPSVAEVIKSVAASC